MADCDDTAVLEVSSECKSVSSRNESRDSITEISNYSTSLEGSVIASPSVESFSLLPENNGFDFSLDSKDLQVRVDNPQKHLDPFETYISFRITTKTSREEFSEKEYIVRRRYSDFIWLRQKLVEDHPSHLVPAIPAKHTLLGQLDRYSRDFVICRMTMLNRFMNRVVNHPILSCNANLKTFLTAKSTEFSSHRKTATTSLLNRMSDSLQNLTTIYGAARSQRSQEFELAADHVTQLGDKLLQLKQIGLRLHKERRELQGESQLMLPILSRWAASEAGNEMNKVLLSTASASDSCTTAHRRNLLDTFNHDFAQPLTEYLMYVDAIKEALARRDAIQVEYEATVDRMAKKRSEKDNLMGGGGESGGAGASGGGGGGASSFLGFNLWKSGTEAREDRLEKLGSTIPKLVKQAELNQDKLEIANENLRSDLQRWRYEKKEDLKKILLKMADNHVKYYQECLSAWERLAGTPGSGTVSSQMAPGSFGSGTVSSQTAPGSFGGPSAVSSQMAPGSFGLATVSTQIVPGSFGSGTVSSQMAPGSFGPGTVFSQMAPGSSSSLHQAPGSVGFNMVEPLVTDSSAVLDMPLVASTDDLSPPS